MEIGVKRDGGNWSEKWKWELVWKVKLIIGMKKWKWELVWKVKVGISVKSESIDDNDLYPLLKQALPLKRSEPDLVPTSLKTSRNLHCMLKI